jgi:hypothetical protein
MMAESNRDEVPQVSNEENELLVAQFSEEEVRDALFQIKHNTALGPDSFPSEFYQVF